MGKGMKGRSLATCHPELPLHGKGLCKSCYGKMRYGPLKRKPRQKATCHPGKWHKARGLCSTCYRRHLWNSNPEYRTRELIAHKKWRCLNREWIKNYNKIISFKSNSQRWDREFGWELGTHQKLWDDATHCALCNEPFVEGDRGLSKHTDHRHGGGTFRGIIHMKCNTALGYLGDSVERCLKAASYLGKYKS